MANVSRPKSDNLSGLAQVPVPVNYSTLTGLALLLADMVVSGKKVIPYIRAISTSAFTSGNYSFPTPTGYEPAPYQLPMLEPQNWNVVADVISAYQPVELYQIGSKSYVNDQGITVPADYMATTFPINIYPGTYPSNAGAIKPIDLNQSVIIRVYKNAGVAINWQSSNILNNGLTDAAIQAATEVTFVVANVLGKYQVTEWITPDFVLTNLNSLPTTAKNNFAAVITEIYNRGIIVGTAAGGDLAGTYPNPTIGAGKVKNTNLAGGITADKFAVGVLPTTLPPSGTAGGDLAGSYPNPMIGNGKITAVKMAPGVIPTTLPPTGTAGGNLAGSYPNPRFADHIAYGVRLIHDKHTFQLFPHYAYDPNPLSGNVLEVPVDQLSYVDSDWGLQLIGYYYSSPYKRVNFSAFAGYCSDGTLTTMDAPTFNYTDDDGSKESLSLRIGLDCEIAEVGGRNAMTKYIIYGEKISGNRSFIVVELTSAIYFPAIERAILSE